MKLTAIALLMCAAGASLGSDKGYSWHADTTSAHLMRLYKGDELVGILDPQAGSWRWTPSGKVHDMIKVLYGPGKRPFDKRVEAKCECGPDCKCGEDCKCAPGRVDKECKCDQGNCKCAIVPKGEAPAGVDERAPVDGSPIGPKLWMLDGVDRGKISTRGRFTVGGTEVSQAEGMDLFSPGSGQIPDDKLHTRIVIIGADALRKQVRGDIEFAPALAWLKNKSIIQDYSPDYWRIKDGGWEVPKDSSKVTIYVQDYVGKVLCRFDSYPGADEMARALRDKVPGYDSSKDPTPKSPVLGKVGEINPWWGLLVAIPGAAWFYNRKKGAK